ncbi:MAG TPA: guanylate kinase [Gammaproteobacteria bacterium]|nr:guanylate kinase [Gammaproteobacteria bacterium]
MPKGHLFVISAPSGAGKTSLVRALMEYTDHLTTSTSYTTRPQRPGEENGKDYHFVDEQTFLSMRAANDFVESAEVFGHFYGTSKSALTKELDNGNDVILEIDWQGAEQVRNLFPDSTGLFILPPSKTILLERLKNRATDSAEVITRRTAEAITEMSHYAEFDYLVINDDFDIALLEAQSIILSFRLKTARQCETHKDLLNELLE